MFFWADHSTSHSKRVYLAADVVRAQGVLNKLFSALEVAVATYTVPIWSVVTSQPSAAVISGYPLSISKIPLLTLTAQGLNPVRFKRSGGFRLQ